MKQAACCDKGVTHYELGGSCKVFGDDVQLGGVTTHNRAALMEINAPGKRVWNTALCKVGSCKVSHLRPTPTGTISAILTMTSSQAHL